MKTHLVLQSTSFVAVTAVLAFALSGCSGGGGGGGAQGCTKDTDCKGDRVCAAGMCVEQPTKEPEDVDPAPESPPGGGLALQDPPTVPANLPAPPAAGAYANDGLPAEIPPPGSSPPTVAEWNAVPREVTVRGSSRLNCETKMLREWLRSSCRTSGAMGTPFMVDTYPSPGQQAFKFVGSGIASVVVQVIRGREFRADYGWDDQGSHTGATLHVRWPSDQPRPTMYFAQDN